MVDYSKWDNLDTDSEDSGSESVSYRKERGQKPQHQKSAAGENVNKEVKGKATGVSSPAAASRTSVVPAGDRHTLDQAESLRLQGNAAYERGDVSTAMGAYEAQLAVLDGRNDEESVAMMCGALLNQASALIHLNKFGDAETRCTRLLGMTTPASGVSTTGSSNTRNKNKGTSGAADVARSSAARARALHFRAFARLRQEKYQEACSDFRSELIMVGGSRDGDEARALLAEAEAGAAMSSVSDPESTGRELLQKGESLEAAKHFRDAAARARRTDSTSNTANTGTSNSTRKSVGENGKDVNKARGNTRTRRAEVALARNMRMEAVAMAAAGDPSSAEMLLKGGLRELRQGNRGVSGDGQEGGLTEDEGWANEEEGLMLAALGGLLAQAGKHREAVAELRSAVELLDSVLNASASTTQGVERESSPDANASTSTASTPSHLGNSAVCRTLAGTLVSLGSSLLAIEGEQRTIAPNTSDREARGAVRTSPRAGNVLTGIADDDSVPDTRRDAGGGSDELSNVTGRDSSPVADGGVADTAAAVDGGEASVTDDAAPMDHPESSSTSVELEAIDVLERALRMLRADTAQATSTEGPRKALLVSDAEEREAISNTGSGKAQDLEGVSGVSNADGGGVSGGNIRGHGHVKRQQTAKVLDALSEAYARGGHWEQARSAADQSLTAWRSLGEQGKAGVAASLLSLGHLLLQLHGVSAGIEEASARWEEAAACFDTCARPSDAAEVRMKVAGFYTKVARSDPSRLETLAEKIAVHYREAGALFEHQRNEKNACVERSAAAAAAAATAAEKTPKEDEAASPPLPPSTMDSLNPDGPSSWELAQREAFAWEGYAGAIGDDRGEASKALRKADTLLNLASVSERNESWTLRKVGVLQSLALSLARCGEHATAEDKLLCAVGELKDLDGVTVDASGGSHQALLVDLHKYIAIARRARGDIPGAKEALTQVETLGGTGGREDVEGLNRLLAHNRISLD